MFLLFLLLPLGEFAAQHLHRLLAVLDLAALVLALHDDPGRDMRDAHRAVRLVDVLTARAAAAVGVYLQILGADYHFAVVLDLGHHFHGSKRGVAARVGIKRGYAHQPVHALFRFQIAVGVIAAYGKSHALYASFVAGEHIQLFQLILLALAVARIHTVKHTHPLLRLRAARARVQSDD